MNDGAHDTVMGQATTLHVLRGAGRFRPTSRLAKWALSELRKNEIVPRHVVGSVNGSRIHLDLDEDVDRKIFLFGSFDARGLKLLRNIIGAAQCRTVLDVGANIGNHVAHFAKWAENVYAFEVNPPIASRLASFDEINQLKNVRIFQFGLSSEDAHLALYTFSQSSGLTTLEKGIAGSTESAAALVRNGDEVMLEERIDSVDFIKLDVQEHEYEVLQGLSTTIARNQPIICMEFCGRSFDKFGGPEELGRMLPGYLFFGTGQSLASKMLKTALQIQPFIYGRVYDHMLCIPSNKIAALSRILKVPREAL